MKVLDVKYIADYSIQVVFDDGVSGIVKLDDLVNKGVFKSLKDKSKFSKVYTKGYSIAWSDELEIDVTKIYLELTNKNFEEIIWPNIHHASN